MKRKVVVPFLMDRNYGLYLRLYDLEFSRIDLVVGNPTVFAHADGKLPSVIADMCMTDRGEFWLVRESE